MTARPAWWLRHRADKPSIRRAAPPRRRILTGCICERWSRRWKGKAF